VGRRKGTQETRDPFSRPKSFQAKLVRYVWLNEISLTFAYGKANESGPFELRLILPGGNRAAQTYQNLIIFHLQSAWNGGQRFVFATDINPKFVFGWPLCFAGKISR